MGLALALLIASIWGGPPAAWASAAASAFVVLPELWGALRRRELDINLLMFAAAAGSLAMGLAQEAAILLFLFALSHVLEGFALGRTRSAIDALAKLRPTTATVIRGGAEVVIAVEEVRPGDQVRVIPYTRVPVDGVILEGRSMADESTLTGEAEPVSKSPGSLLAAGVQNLEGSVILECTAAAGDSHIERVQKMMDDAMAERSPGEKVGSWFGARYTLAVFAFFFVSLGIRLLIGQPLADSLLASLAGFVALSPCAFVLAAPAASLSAQAFAARRGVLARGGDALSRAAEIDSAAFDKTGTLTTGRLRLESIKLGDSVYEIGPNLPEEVRRILSHAAALEDQADHPVARAITAAARRLKLDLPRADEVRVLPGQGVEGLIGGKPWRAVRPEEDAKTGEGVRSEVLVESPNYQARLRLIDEMRPGAAQAVRELKDAGISRLIVLSGDAEAPVAAAAKAAGIADWISRASPADKEARLAKWAKEGRKTAMVGDGVNDGPALSRAHLGVAMGDLGSDVALGAADVVLSSGRLGGILMLSQLGQRMNRVIHQSLAIAAVAAGTGVVLSLSIDAFPPETRRLIIPVVVVLHEGSTVAAILNGLRLLRPQRAASK